LTLINADGNARLTPARTNGARKKAEVLAYGHERKAVTRGDWSGYFAGVRNGGTLPTTSRRYSRLPTCATYERLRDHRLGVGAGLALQCGQEQAVEDENEQEEDF